MVVRQIRGLPDANGEMMFGKVSDEVLNLIPGALELKGNERRPKGFQRTSWISLPVDE